MLEKEHQLLYDFYRVVDAFLQNATALFRYSGEYYSDNICFVPSALALFFVEGICDGLD